MTPHFQAFLDEIAKRGHVASEWSYMASDHTKLVHAAKDPKVGPLVLIDEAEEITLEFGTKYHFHFDGQEADEYDTDRVHCAAMNAADYVDRILRERIGVAVHYNDRGCIGAELIYLDALGLTPESLKIQMLASAVA